MTKPACPNCSKDSLKVMKKRILRIRRRDKALALVVIEYECEECHYKLTTEPSRNEINEIWLERFGEDIPDRGKPGRGSTGVPRTIPVQFMLTPAELQSIDDKRGSMSRSAWIRSLIFDVAC